MDPTQLPADQLNAVLDNLGPLSRVIVTVQLVTLLACVCGFVLGRWDGRIPWRRRDD